MNHPPITRRDAIKNICKISSGIVAANCLPVSVLSKMAFAANTPEKWLVEGHGQSPGYSVRDLTRRVFEKAGGMARFVSKGDVVVIKVNISWAREPALAQASFYVA